MIVLFFFFFFVSVCVFQLCCKIDVCVCVCLFVMYKKKKKRRKKEKRRYRAHRSENEQFCVQYLHESKTLSFFFFVLFSNIFSLSLCLSSPLSRTHYSVYFSVVYSFFLINDALAFRFLFFLSLLLLFHLFNKRSNKKQIIHSFGRQINM